MKHTTSLSESIALRTELLGIVGGAVDFLIGAFAAVARVETFVAFIALKASLVPWLEIKI